MPGGRHGGTALLIGHLTVDIGCHGLLPRSAGVFWRPSFLSVRGVYSRAMISFMICAVPSPISSPMTSRKRC